MGKAPSNAELALRACAEFIFLWKLGKPANETDMRAKLGPAYQSAEEQWNKNITIGYNAAKLIAVSTDLKIPKAEEPPHEPEGF